VSVNGFDILDEPQKAKAGLGRLIVGLLVQGPPGQNLFGDNTHLTYATDASHRAPS
jgi:hypothetical protein